MNSMDTPSYFSAAFPKRHNFRDFLFVSLVLPKYFQKSVDSERNNFLLEEEIVLE